MPDKMYLSLKFRVMMGKKLNLKNPQTFNEKLQWLKLYDRKPIYTTMVDKYEAKKYVASIIGEEYIIPTLGVWDSPDEIDFDSLPDQFVLKCNHNSGRGMCICTDKSKLDIEAVKRGLQKGLNENYYITNREWPYKDVPRKVIAEKYMVDGADTELKDYKFMCFGGRAYCSFVCSDRFSEDGLKVTFYDREWKKMPFIRHYPSSVEDIEMPKQYYAMMDFAEKLSKDIPFVRVDFYEVEGHLYFGELTFYPGSGMEEFEPEEWDYKLGDWVKLPGCVGG
ncbi:MAG: glycosyl transferase [Oscillospiraceae bacterium]|nr:glycosyl transferase [Oscillospiraceae bacterium]